MNLATFIVGAVIAAIVFAVIATEIKNKKNGKCSCNGNCGTCGSNCRK